VYRTRTENGELDELATVGPGDYVGAKASFLNQAHSASVKAFGPLTCFEIREKYFRDEVVPILRLLKERSEQYKSFDVLIV
jgi:CRP-like cAMP-binding protein